MDRRNQEHYFEAALDLLAEGGADALTIASLCTRLGVTKGSFYHHFRNIREFHAALLDHWETGRSYALAEQLVSITDPLERIEFAKHLGVGLYHEAESAIRAWARTNPVVAEVQRRVDAAREAALTLAFVDAGIDRSEAAVLARIGLTILVGTQQMEDRVDRTRLAAVFDEYHHWLIAARVEAARV